jgi:predicted small secreted protein
MKNLTIVLLALLATLSLSACNTMAGLGKDVEKGGEVLQKAATK